MKKLNVKSNYWGRLFGIAIDFKQAENKKN